MLHECLSVLIDPALGVLAKFPSAATAAAAKELEAKKRLAVNSHAGGGTPAHAAANRDHIDCVRVLTEIGGTESLLAQVVGNPSILDAGLQRNYSCLLSEPGLLNLQAKQAWLTWSLSQNVADAGAEQLGLVCNRSSVLEGLRTQFGVDETTGQLLSGVAARPRALEVQFAGENGTGDGLRREWFDVVVAELFDPARGLVLSRDGGRTFVPNPHSATTAGADHLSYFALLGRITGLALFHREPINAPWSTAFIKAVFEFELSLADLESVDPEVYEKRIVYIQDSIYASRDGLELSDLDLTFTDTGEPALLYNSVAEQQASASIELKDGGSGISVTEDNKAEYLQLLAEHRLVGAIQAQIAFFRDGLGVFVTAELRATLQQCATVADLQLLMCGVQEIDVNDWEASAEYAGGFDARSPTVRWFWSAVRCMTNEERSALLHFCTGSARVPATGFSTLMGYSGQQQRFRLECTEGGSERLPTAPTCFNTLRLPDTYTGEAQLLERLRRAMREAQGFDEGAVAV